MDNTESDLIYTYTRKQAIKDGEQVLLKGEKAELAKDIYKYPVYLTRGITALIDKAVAHPKHHNDYLGVFFGCQPGLAKNLTCKQSNFK